MVFNSFVFWAFFFIVIGLYRLLGHRAQNWLLLISSYVFYGWWDWRFLFLMAGSTVTDFFFAQWVENAPDARRRRRWVIVSIVLNLAVLGFFKYCNFFIENAREALAVMGLETHAWTLNVILPVGISFYTFQQMSYVIDVYRGQLKATRRFFDFALYVAYFPQLVAGPIERSTHLMPQITQPRVHRDGDFAEGLYLVLYGLFKKVVIADNMAYIVNAIFASPVDELTGGECLVGIYAFAFQIYGDFSGYSSMAQGVSLWLGIRLMDNFRMPYFAVSPSDFWTRWHISLSSWLRDYLYIPLGGNRGGRWLTYRNLLLTMLLGGLWHGAAWTFVVWGAFHGLILCLYRVFENPAATRKDAPPAPFWMRALQMVLMFHLVCLGWLFFRAESMTQAWGMLAAMIHTPVFTPLALSAMGLIAFFALPMLAFEAWLESKKDLLAPLKVHWAYRGVAYNYCALMLLFMAAEVPHAFIYFQF